jgi:DNA-binding MarR family transcriptional regulator
MHQLFFQFKRSHWGIQNTLRGPVKRIVEGMTPARMDMFYALERQYGRGPREQRLLSGMLGVVKSVVSRMLKSMEALGWIRREKAEYDRRMWLITLTKAGKEAFESLYAMFCKSRAMARCVFHALGGKRWKHHRDDQLWHLMLFDEYAKQIGDWFRGGGTIYYPWGHPDD